MPVLHHLFTGTERRFPHVIYGVLADRPLERALIPTGLACVAIFLLDALTHVLDVTGSGRGLVAAWTILATLSIVATWAWFLVSVEIDRRILREHAAALSAWELLELTLTTSRQREWRAIVRSKTGLHAGALLSIAGVIVLAALIPVKEVFDATGAWVAGMLVLGLILVVAGFALFRLTIWREGRSKEVA